MLRRLERGPSLLLAIVATSILTSHSGHAAPLTWDSDSNFGNGVTDGSGTWNATNANWNNGTSDAAWVAGSTAVIGSSTASTTGGTITVAGTQALDGLTLRTGAANYTLTGGTLDFGSSNAAVTIVNDGKLTLNSALAGSGTLSFTTGASGWQRGAVLGGNNSAFTGKMSFTRTAGNYFFVSASNENAFGATPAAYTADSITFSGVSLWQTGNLTFSANRGITIGSGGLSVYGSAGGTATFNNLLQVREDYWSMPVAPASSD